LLERKIIAAQRAGSNQHNVAARRYSDAALKKLRVPAVPVVMVMMTMVVGVIGVVMPVMVAMMVVTIVMMVVTMMIAVPSCGWHRAADCNCADNA